MLVLYIWVSLVFVRLLYRLKLNCCRLFCILEWLFLMLMILWWW